jgi:glycosidase
LQNEAFNFTKKLLHWRAGNDAVKYGALKHFSPSNGTYIYERKYGDKSTVVIMNGTDKEQTISLQPYSEVLPRHTAYEVLTDKDFELGENLTLSSRDILILDFNR